MRIHLLTVCQRVPDWVNNGYQEYAKRLPREIDLKLIQIPPPNLGAKSDAQRSKELEGEKILALIPKGYRTIALDEKGTSSSTKMLSGKLEQWMRQWPDVVIIIGGANGLAPAIKQRADEVLSLSDMTFPHTLVRVLLAEQIYRAWTILKGHPYHRE